VHINISIIINNNNNNGEDMTTQTFIDNMTKYLVQNYDGQPHEWTDEQQGQLFDDIFHDDLRMISFDHSSSQQRMSPAQAIFGTKQSRFQEEQKSVTFGTHYDGRDGKEFYVIDDTHIRWNASFHNSQVTADHDYMVEIKDGKAVAIEPYNQATAIKPLYRKFIAMFDGTKNEDSSLTPYQLEIIDTLFHNDCTKIVGGGDGNETVAWDKTKLKAIIAKSLAVGTIDKERFIHPLDETHLHVQLEVKNDVIADGIIVDTIMTIQDGKIIKIVPHEPETLTNFVMKVEDKIDQQQPQQRE
jgi:hypothetical protein